MVDGKLLTEKLLRYAEKFLYLNKRDEIYYRNLLLREFNLDEPYSGDEDLSYIDVMSVPDDLVLEVEEYGKENGLLKDGLTDLYSTYIFGILSPKPSEVNKEFYRIRNEQGIVKACEYLYGLSVKNNYVRKTAIGKNLKWEYVDGKRTLEITVNLSKPEKDNKEIAKLLSMPKNNKYPACFLCKENEGFMGTASHPARENIRTVSLQMGNEPWFVQYSPYAYYNEHMIAISEKHVPMHIEKDTVDKLFDFIEVFPNYMIGSNAALPIIGGSILNHEHFQGGGHLMPMHKAPFLKVFKCKDIKGVKVGIVDWYNSVIRIESKNRKSMTALMERIIKAWQNYTDEKLYIYAETNGVRHNSLAPVLRKEGKVYIADMILRNNITTEEFKDGLFHAHPEYHNIKKEGIGLIEAMGLFILPGRLKKQIEQIADILCGSVKYDEKALNNESNYLYPHRFMIKELFESGKCKSKEEAEEKIRNKINEVCKNILYNTAVFKSDNEGYNGFIKFLNSVNIK